MNMVRSFISENILYGHDLKETVAVVLRLFVLKHPGAAQH